MTQHEPMPYMPPTADEIRFLIRKYWQDHRDPSKRANADDQDFLELKVRATQQLLESLIHAGLEPHEAESQAMREVALADCRRL